MPDLPRFNLPERKGFTIVHQHDLGQPCVLKAQPDVPFICRYERTLWSRLTDWIRL